MVRPFFPGLVEKYSSCGMIENDYEEWSKRYHDATIAMENREEQVEAISNELEQELRLLGATAIEDKLQDGVPETIADLKRAGIKIWVATGDKLETAIGAYTSDDVWALFSLSACSNWTKYKPNKSGFQYHHRPWRTSTCSRAD